MTSDATDMTNRLASESQLLRSESTPMRSVQPVAQANQLALWPESQRAMPVAFARSALFRAAAKASERRRVEGEIAAAPGVSLHYVGEELRTNDEEVLMYLLHELRGRDLKKPDELVVHKTRHELLLDLDRSTSGHYYAELEQTMDRLATGTLKLHYTNPRGKRFKITQSIVRKFAIADRTGANPRWSIWVEPEILQLFAIDGDYFHVSWRERARLRRPLAKWLHSYLYSLRLTAVAHIAIQLEDVFRLSGSEAATLTNFKVVLRRCLDELSDQGAIGSWRIARDLLYVTGPGVPSVDRALAHKASIQAATEVAVPMS